jgi:hypothetical protein
MALTFCLLCIVLSAVTAHAESGNGDSWQFQIAPYGWLAGQEGTVATLPGLPPADIDIDFWDDILGNINGSLFLVGEARKGRYGVFLDAAYVDIEMEEDTPGAVFSSVSSQTKSWIVSLAGFYRVFEKPRAFLDILAGARYWSVDSSLSLGAGVLPAQEVSSTEEWFDPLVGLKGLSYLGASKIYISAGLLVGGFGAGSDLMWDAVANLGYRWTRTFSTIIGYRYMDVDYEKDDFLYDVAQHGPILGLSWRF